MREKENANDSKPLSLETKIYHPPALKYKLQTNILKASRVFEDKEIPTAARAI